MKLFLKSNLAFIFVVILAAILRLYELGKTPISLNHDETALGYNAYTFLTTGADEFGKFLPLSLRSFGDWKLPIYPLLDTVPILFLGLTEVAVRLPSALSGIGSVILVYFISQIIFGKKKIAFLAALFLTISPWGIFFSRIAYEANVATLFFLGGLLCFLKFYYQKGSNKLLIITSILWGLTIFTYHAFVVFMPLYFIVLFTVPFIGQKTFRKKLLFPIFIFSCFVIVAFYNTLTAGSIGKLSSTSLFDNQKLLNDRVNIFRADESGENKTLGRILHNKYTAVSYQIGQNYLASFSPTFLFDKGGEKFLHNIGNFGNFYLIDAFLILLGVFGVLYRRQDRLLPLYIWLIVGPIPSAITTDAPSSTRLFLLLPLLILLIAFGTNFLLETLSKLGKLGNLFKMLFVGFYAISFMYFVDAYFVHMNYHKAQFFHYGYKEAVELSNRYPNYKVIMFGPENFPYISFLFYNKYDPAEFQKTVKFYPENHGPFLYVKSFGRYNFVDDIDYENLQPNTLYIDYRGIRNEDYKILDPSEQPVFKYFFKNPL